MYGDHFFGGVVALHLSEVRESPIRGVGGVTAKAMPTQCTLDPVLMWRLLNKSLEAEVKVVLVWCCFV